MKQYWDSFKHFVITESSFVNDSEVFKKNK